MIHEFTKNEQKLLRVEGQKKKFFKRPRNFKDALKVINKELEIRIEENKKMELDIKLARQKIKKLSDEMNADRERLIKDKLETEKYKDDAYYKFLEMLDDEELKGLKGTMEK